MCVSVCVCVSRFQLFLHIGNRHSRNIIFILATTAKKAKGARCRYNGWIEVFAERYKCVSVCVCSCVCQCVCVEYMYDTSFLHNNVYESKFRVGDNTLQQLIMEKYMGTHGN